MDRLSSLRVYLYNQVERLPDVLGRVPFVEYMDRLIELDSRGHGDKYQVFRCLERDFGMTSGTWQQLLDDYETYFPHVCVHFPKAHQTLGTLRERGLKLGLVTNGPVESQQPKIDGLGIAGYFGTILISGAEGVSKPDPEIFHRAVRNLGVAAEETVMIGDQPGGRHWRGQVRWHESHLEAGRVLGGPGSGRRRCPGSRGAAGDDKSTQLTSRAGARCG